LPEVNEEDFDLSLIGFDGLLANLDEEPGKCRSASSLEPFGPTLSIAESIRLAANDTRAESGSGAE